VSENTEDKRTVLEGKAFMRAVQNALGLPMTTIGLTIDANLCDCVTITTRSYVTAEQVSEMGDLIEESYELTKRADK